MPSSHTDYMKQAIALAERGRGRTSPNPIVGCVVVRNGEIVGEGYHHRAGAPHAEINALNQAGSRAQGATLYVTLEPCNHHGRTPPCSNAILNAGIQKVYYGCPDPHPHARGGAETLRQGGLTVHGGLLQSQCAALNRPFFTAVSKCRPFVLWKMASTLDGHTAERSGNSLYITGPNALHRVHELRNHLDAIVVGGRTVARDNPSLTCRGIPGGRDPLRVVVDSTLRHCDPEAKLFTELAQGTLVFCGNRQNSKRLSLLRSRGVEVIQTTSPRPSPELLLHHLLSRGINGVLLEGGAQLATAFLLARAVDRVLLFFAPKLLLDRDAPLLAGTDHHFSLNTLPSLTHTSVGKCGKDLFIEGDLEYPKEWP